MLRDAEVMHATHISVVDKMLQDMLNARPSALAQYECVLLGGGPLNAKTVARALEAGGARVCQLRHDRDVEPSGEHADHAPVHGRYAASARLFGPYCGTGR